MAELKKKVSKKAAKGLMKKNKRVVTASVVGGVVGSVTTLLFAPKAGKELRKDLSGKVTSAKDKTSKLSANTKDKVSYLSEKSKSLATKLKRDEKGNEDTESESALYSEDLEDTRGVIDEPDKSTDEKASDNKKQQKDKKETGQKSTGQKKTKASKKLSSGSDKEKVYASKEAYPKAEKKS